MIIFKRELTKHGYNSFKIFMVKLYGFWGHRDTLIEKYFPDMKKLPFMEDMHFKQFLHVSWFFNPCKGRDNL